MDPLDALVSAFSSVIETSHDLYAEHGGDPEPDSTAAIEVSTHDDELEKATGTPRPVFGAYADAESKLRALIDLISSFLVLIDHSDTTVGQVVVARAAIETAARMYWGLAIGYDYRERAARWLRERLRSIDEVGKLGKQPRLDMEQNGFSNGISEGAARAGLSVPGRPPAAIDLIWPLLTAAESPLEFDGIDREATMLLFYRSPSALTHGSPLGLQSHFAIPRDDESRRSTRVESIETTLILMAAMLNGFANAHGALIALYGWNPDRIRKTQGDAAHRLSLTLHDVRS